ncbi:hypothetical protein [Asticcacaulis solisilvae]|uniref:hypothetical protein n=1 Tax=Asticcacaulis solisilvae TaxID=1217274 RepID=UPI003FD74B9D
MTSSMLFRTVCAGAVFAGLALVPVVASAQQPARLDGYCYVRQTDMQRNSAVDSYGVKRAYARCYNGVYYAYSGESYSAPAAPEGYQVAYYTRRPADDTFTRVVDADSRYASDSSYSSSTYTGGDRYATTSSYDTQGYDANAGYGRSSGTYRQDSDAYDDSRGSNDSYSDDRNSGDRYDDRDGGRDYRRGDDRYQGDDRDYSRHTAVVGWRDDSGQWHLGRPRAVGWQDDNGRWHVGEVQAYGWRDARGQWHESQDDSADAGSDSRYTY